MIVIPIIYHNDGHNDDIIDYAAMEREFKKEMNLLVDEEMRQDNDLSSPQSRFNTIMRNHIRKNDLNPGSRL